MTAASPTASPEPGLLRALRDGDWLTAERARIFTIAWLGVSVVVAVAWIGLSRHGLDILGKPIGTDFISFWTASRIALSGRPSQVYDVAVHHAAQTQPFGREVGYYAFFYPPIFLLICLPLAGLPYLASLAAWLAATGAAYAKVVRGFLGGRGGWVAVFAFPAVLINLGHGQNAFLSAALFGGAVLIWDRRPFLAGILIGCLAYKPQLGLLIPIALLAAGRWRTIAGAAAAVAALAAASLAAFGVETWRAFIAASPLARAALEQGLVGDAKMQSVFAAARLLHGGLGLAYAVQVVTALAGAAALVAMQRKAPRAPAEGPALVAASLLASPFLLDYDLILLAIPLAWLTAQGLKTGFRPYEKTVLAAAYIAPALTRTIASATGVPLGPVAVAAVFILVLRRWAEPIDATSAA
jgi:hypothetical protein